MFQSLSQQTQQETSRCTKTIEDNNKFNLKYLKKILPSDLYNDIEKMDKDRDKFNKDSCANWADKVVLSTDNEKTKKNKETCTTRNKELVSVTKKTYNRISKALKERITKKAQRLDSRIKESRILKLSCAINALLNAYMSKECLEPSGIDQLGRYLITSTDIKQKERSLIEGFGKFMEEKLPFHGAIGIILLSYIYYNRSNSVEELKKLKNYDSKLLVYLIEYLSKMPECKES